MENQDRKKTRKPVWILLLSLVCVLVVFAGVWLVLHEKTQSRNIVSLVTRAEEQAAMEESLSAAIDTLSERINRQDKNREPAVWGTGYNWFAIGNSLTLIEGFGHGICSTQPDNDYFGIVKAFLEKQYGDVTANRVHFGVWEQSAYRNAMFDFVDPYLSPDLDLVTVQLGENVSVIERPVSGYREDLKELVFYIRKKCPSAQIIMIDDFWDNRKSDIRREVAEETDIDFADLSEIRGKKEYQSEAGIEFLLSNGKTETVSEEAATHPGDSGMAYIADRVIEKIAVK